MDRLRRAVISGALLASAVAGGVALTPTAAAAGRDRCYRPRVRVYYTRDYDCVPRYAARRLYFREYRDVDYGYDRYRYRAPRYRDCDDDD
jgi:hypothetical protein